MSRVSEIFHWLSRRPESYRPTRSIQARAAFLAPVAAKVKQNPRRCNTSVAAAKTAHAKTALQRQIDATDRQIDQLVYEFYGLTDDEIRIVEEATQ